MILEIIGLIIIIIAILLVIGSFDNDTVTCCTIPIGIFIIILYVASNGAGKLLIFTLTIIITGIIYHLTSDNTDTETNNNYDRQIENTTQERYPEYNDGYNLYDINTANFRFLVDNGIISDSQAKGIIHLRDYNIYITDFNDLKYLGFNRRQISAIKGEYHISPYHQSQQFNYNKNIIDTVMKLDDNKPKPSNNNIIKHDDWNHSDNRPKPTPPKQEDIKPNIKPTIEKPKQKIDINTATRDEISKLPGINIMHVNKIMQMRENGNYITSTNDLKDKLNLKDYQINHLMDYIVITGTDGREVNCGRKVDL